MELIGQDVFVNRLFAQLLSKFRSGAFVEQGSWRIECFVNKMVKYGRYGCVEKRYIDEVRSDWFVEQVGVVSAEERVL